jgi:hypothetical protein
VSQWAREHPELVGHPDHDPWMRHESYRKVAPMSEVERDRLRDERDELEAIRRVTRERPE